MLYHAFLGGGAVPCLTWEVLYHTYLGRYCTCLPGGVLYHAQVVTRMSYDGLKVLTAVAVLLAGDHVRVQGKVR